MLNVIAIMGRLVADPQLRQTQQGTSVASFRIACDRNRADQNGQRQADFFDVVAWRGTAEFVCKYFQKGSLIAIDGQLQSRQYQDKNGNNRTAIEIVASNINFAGSKNSSGSSGGNYGANNGGNAGGNSYGAPAPQPPQYSHPAPPEATSYSSGNDDEFAVIQGDPTDLPF